MPGPILSSQPQSMTEQQILKACFDSTNNVLNVGISAESIDLDIEGPAAQDAAVTGNPVQISFESADFDGSALPNAVGAEGDIVRPKASLEGVPYVMLVNEDGGQTPTVAHDTAISAASGGSVGLMPVLEAKDFDGSALPNSVVEGNAIRQASTLNGVAFNFLVNEDGSKSPHATDDSAQVATPDFLNIGGEYRAATDTYTDGDAVIDHYDINGHKLVRSKSYDPGTTADKSAEVSPLDQHYIEESLVDTTNVAAAAQYYPASTGALVGNHKDFSFTGKFIEGAGETITMLVQGMNDEDTASGDWITLYGYRDDLNSTTASVVATNQTTTYSWSFNDFNYKYYRVVVTPDSATNTAIVKLRKKAL